MRDELVEMFLCEKGQIGIVADFLSVAQILFRDKVYADLMAEIVKLITVAGDADGDDFLVLRVVQNGVRVVDCSVYCIGIDVLVEYLIFSERLATRPDASSFSSLSLYPLHSMRTGYLVPFLSVKISFASGRLPPAPPLFEA